jgi:hypothetical protein
MPDPADLIADVKLDFSVALTEMMRQAETMPCTNTQEAAGIGIFLHLIQDFYVEQKALLLKIQEAGKILQKKLADYKALKPNNSLDDL